LVIEQKVNTNPKHSTKRQINDSKTPKCNLMRHTNDGKISEIYFSYFNLSSPKGVTKH